MGCSEPQPARGRSFAFQAPALITDLRNVIKLHHTPRGSKENRQGPKEGEPSKRGEEQSSENSPLHRSRSSGRNAAAGRAGSCSGSHSNGISWRALQKSLPGRRQGEKLPGICTLSPDLQPPARIQLPGTAAPGRTARAKNLPAATVKQAVPTAREEHPVLRRDTRGLSWQEEVFFSSQAGDDNGGIISATRDPDCTEDKIEKR